MHALKVACLVLFDPINIRYVTGFTGGEGVLVVRERGVALLVDGRYVTQAKEEVPPEVEVVPIREPTEALVSYLGELDAAPVGVEAHAVSYAQYVSLRRGLRGMKIRPCIDIVEPIRVTKDETEITAMKGAVDVAEAALGDVLPLLQPGVTEREMAMELDYRMKRRGAEDVSFPTIVASGPRAALPHARPSDRCFSRGDTVVIDFGAVVDGYHSDETCTFLLGRDTDILDGYRVVKEAHDHAIEAIRPGVAAAEIDGRARDVIARAGYGAYFTHGTGHGVGLMVHEEPRLGPKSRQVLEEGMVFTVEPGIYLPDRWGIRLEDMVVVTGDGSRLLTGISKQLTIID